MATIWLLGVDGVVNAGKAGWGRAPLKAAVYAGQQQYAMRWEPKVIDRIRELHKGGTVEVRWCSTWCAFAGELERLWNLPPLERAFLEPLNGRAASMAKLAAAAQVLADGHRLIWTDDMEVPERGELYERMTFDNKALLISPWSSRGLRPEHMAAIEEFAAQE
jgi:hypothetical protein